MAAGALVCHSFATLGFCEKGAGCSERHVHECPKYSNTGACDNVKCGLPHVDRAGQIRKHTTDKTDAVLSASRSGGAEAEDVSSDDRDYDTSDHADVDSDVLEEPESVTAHEYGGLSPQQDFVRFD